ncbi:MAG: nicotinamide mononucleotide transporter [Flavobacteriales bacterium]|nr:nicotinamide mononucleotide transporter [Flavobacteriales bacterium]
MYLALEIIAVALSLAFLFLLIKEVKWCWPFGIASSALSIALFIEARLYSEAILYLFYVIIGFYGWWVWTSKSNQKGTAMPIQRLSLGRSILLFGLGTLGAYALGATFERYTDAANPFVDATTTSFSFVASFLEAHKAISAWLYWVVINGISIWLYSDRGLPIYSALMVVYLVVSVYGWFDWKNKWTKASA